MKIAIIGMNKVPNQFTRFVSNYGFTPNTVPADREDGRKGSLARFPTDVEAAIFATCQSSHGQYYDGKKFYKKRGIRFFEGGSSSEIKEDFEKFFKFDERRKLVYGKTWSMSIPFIMGLMLRKDQRFTNQSLIAILSPYFKKETNPTTASMNNVLRTMVENGEVDRRSKGKYTFNGLAKKTFNRLKRSGLELPEKTLLETQLSIVPPEPPPPIVPEPSIEAESAQESEVPEAVVSDNADLFLDTLIKMQESITKLQESITTLQGTVESQNQTIANIGAQMVLMPDFVKMGINLGAMTPEQVKHVATIVAAARQIGRDPSAHTH